MVDSLDMAQTRPCTCFYSRVCILPTASKPLQLHVENLIEFTSWQKKATFSEGVAMQLTMFGEAY